MLENISAYGWPASYVADREGVVRSMDVGSIQNLAQEYLDPNQMIWLVVGDAATQLERLSELGYGDPILLNGR